MNVVRRLGTKMLVMWALSALAMVELPRSAAAQGETGNVCVRDYRSGAVCTANDVRIEALNVVSVLEDCLTGVVGETEVVFEALISSAGSPDRYDIGLFLALDGGSARDGNQCYHDFLSGPLTATPTYGDKNSDTIPDIDGGPWWNGGTDSDQCGDIQASTQLFKTLPPLRFACIDNNGDGSADVSVCTSWDNNTGSTCNTVLNAFPGTNSKCSCATVELGIPPAPELTVTKTPPTQTVLSGGTATFTITLDSRTLLTGVSLSDPQCTTLTGPTGDDGDNVLETSETWTYTCTVANVAAGFTNTATANATSPNGPVSDSDTATVTVNAPGISVSKTPPTQAVASGGTAMFTITVDNTGNVDLTGVTVSDPQCTSLAGPMGDDGDAVLEVPETWTYTCSVTNVTAGFINTVDVTATPPSGPDVSGSATAEVTINAPSVTVSKTPPAQQVLSGGTATFTITVDNSGNQDLFDVTLSDPQCTTLAGPTGDDGDTVLETTETWTYSCSVTGVTADFTNTVSVTATPADESPDVSDTDSAEVTVASPSIAVSKTPDSQSVASGGTATFTITVDNTGNVDLTNVTISDPQCSTPAGPTGDDGDGVLETAETWSYTCSVSNVTADFTNSATVTATPPVGPDVSDTDEADVTVAAGQPLIVAAKESAFNLQTHDLDHSGTLSPGDRLQYTVTISNNGSADALNVVFTDTPDPNTALVVGSVTTSQGTVLSGNTAGNTNVTVNIGTVPAAGQVVVVTFEVTIDNPFPAGVTQVLNQGLVAGDNFPDTPTDNPDTTPTGDATVDVVQAVAPPVPIPTLSQWSFLLFLLLLVAAAIWHLRRTSASAG
jgi:uncharacterized repeat protein (TIGR01451 family)